MSLLDEVVVQKDQEIAMLKADRDLLIAVYDAAKVCIDEYIASAGSAAGITGSNVTAYTAVETAAVPAAAAKYF